MRACAPYSLVLTLWAGSALLIIAACQVDLRDVECTSSLGCPDGFTCFQGRCVQYLEEDVNPSDHGIFDRGRDRRTGDDPRDADDDPPVADTADTDSHGVDAETDESGDVVSDTGDDARRDPDMTVEDVVEDVGEDRPVGEVISVDPITTDPISVDVFTDRSNACSDCTEDRCVSLAGFDCAAIDPRCVPEQFSLNLSTEGDDLKVSFRLVPDGLYIFGTNELPAPHGPEHFSSVAPFYMMTTEVTAAHMQQCVLEDSVTTSGCTAANVYAGSEDNYCTYDRVGWESAPVNCVSWDGANEFCQFLGGRLPTEAEWEKAARGSCALLGSSRECEIAESAPRDNTRFPWGDESPGCGRVCASMMGCGAPARVMPCATADSTHPSSASVYGLVDMVGNVAEWTTDFYKNNVHSTGTLTYCPYVRGGTDLQVVIKGGSFETNKEEDLLISRRDAAPPSTFVPTIGFRCVIDVDEIPIEAAHD